MFQKWAYYRHVHENTCKIKSWEVNKDVWTHKHPFGLVGGCYKPSPRDYGYNLNIIIIIIKSRNMKSCTRVGTNILKY